GEIRGASIGSAAAVATTLGCVVLLSACGFTVGGFCGTGVCGFCCGEPNGFVGALPGGATVGGCTGTGTGTATGAIGADTAGCALNWLEPVGANGSPGVRDSIRGDIPRNDRLLC